MTTEKCLALSLSSLSLSPGYLMFFPALISGILVQGRGERFLGFWQTIIARYVGAVGDESAHFRFPPTREKTGERPENTLECNQTVPDRPLRKSRELPWNAQEPRAAICVFVSQGNTLGAQRNGLGALPTAWETPLGNDQESMLRPPQSCLG